MVSNMPLTTLGNSSIKISSVGFGCMGLSEFYGKPASQATASKLINHALDNGVNFFDTADMYGSGHNECILGQALLDRRKQAVIATKFGIVRENGAYSREINGTPEYVRKACTESLRRLKTDFIDLYYIHRIDKNTPIEDTVGAMSRLVEEGKIRAIALCEASAETLRRAHAVYPISALQSEYSMFTRDPEQHILSVTQELGTSFVAYSPICRGLLGLLKPADGQNDFRNSLPRFQGAAYAKNTNVAQQLNKIALAKGCTLAQLSIAWVMAQSSNVIPIPGTTKIKNLTSNIQSVHTKLSNAELQEIDNILTSNTIKGERYTQEGMKGVGI